MPPLTTLSKVGFGAYRIAAGNDEHHDALLHALRNGCNLIDTSANYTNGKSEELIGSILKKEPALNPFIVTKAGYIQNDNLKVLAALQSAGRAREEVVDIKEGFKHSIHPDFLNSQIHQSLKRLGKDHLDVFLLHNPEYYFRSQGEVTVHEYYQRIRKAFSFLEEKVKEGLVGFYGISSNTLPVAPEEKNATDLTRVLAIAKSIAENHHFRFIEFPYNLAETGAATSYDGKPSMLTVARENNITTLANRPLNASLNGKPVRLATYQQDINGLATEKEQELFTQFIARLSQYLKEQENDIDLYELEIVAHLSKNWMSIGNPEAVEKLFHQHFLPVIATIYEDEIPNEIQKEFRILMDTAIAYARKTMTERAYAVAMPLLKPEFHAEATRSLSAAAVNQYLSEGIDHVLVGMRRKRYVEDMRQFF
jgi:aryl-alcohol dehydrogenase-like predicted oxidoreductase